MHALWYKLNTSFQEQTKNVSSQELEHLRQLTAGRQTTHLQTVCLQYRQHTVKTHSTVDMLWAASTVLSQKGASFIVPNTAH